MDHGEAWLGEKREQVAHPEDQHFSILQPGIRAATAHEATVSGALRSLSQLPTEGLVFGEHGLCGSGLVPS